MGKALFDAFAPAREVLLEVDDVLSQHLSRLMFEGPQEELTLTENAQPAIMACSVAALRVMEREVGINISETLNCVAGHSLGEYSALVCAGTITLAQAARLLKIRGQSMQQAVAAGDGAMAAIIGLELAAVETICAEVAQSGDVCEIANHNSSAQLVISGVKHAVEQAMELAKEAGAKRALALPVSAPFHCSLMQPAAERMLQELAATPLQDAAIPVITNVDAEPTIHASDIRQKLVQQVTQRVRWQDTMQQFQSRGITRLVELGHGKVLTGLAKRECKDMVLANIASPEDIEQQANAA